MVRLHCGNVASTNYVIAPMKDSFGPHQDGESY